MWRTEDTAQWPVPWLWEAHPEPSCRSAQEKPRKRQWNHKRPQKLAHRPCQNPWKRSPWRMCTCACVHFPSRGLCAGSA